MTQRLREVPLAFVSAKVVALGTLCVHTHDMIPLGILGGNWSARSRCNTAGEKTV